MLEYIAKAEAKGHRNLRICVAKGGPWQDLSLEDLYTMVAVEKLGGKLV